jgi:hypothetical protein
MPRIGKPLAAAFDSEEVVRTLREFHALMEMPRGRNPHHHINRFYWSVLTPWQEPVLIKSMGY